jgi:magnesium chelatase subunit I
MHPKTLGELRSTPFGTDQRRLRSVKDEMRENLLDRLRNGQGVFDGILGYEDSVVPHVVNAVLSRHNMILLGLRGQAKSRILRQLARLLDDEIPVIEGCEINDNPFAPVCRKCRDLVATHGDDVPITFRSRDERYVEKLATPDVTIADMIGDIDPIKAAKGGHELGNELTVHFGLLPRSNRGIFAINELPDLAGKIQVGLFNIMQEGDVQIKGYPLRLPLDVALVFSANPEDYTARGKIVTPLKDRIGSEILTHYPPDLDHGVAITEQEAWTAREGVLVPRYIREVVEAIAFRARDDQRIDKRSGVSQRLPISCLENAASNAERRRAILGETQSVIRIADVYGALPAITGKLELEYEGELKGAETIARDLIRQAVQTVFRQRVPKGDFKRVVEWFDMGGTLKVGDMDTASDLAQYLDGIQGLMELTAGLDVTTSSSEAERVAAAEFVLEGLCSVDKISRTEERGYGSTESRSDDRQAIDDLYRDYSMDPKRYRKKNLN